jgi:hypothetical protein
MLLAMNIDSSTLIGTTPARQLQVASTSQQRAQAVFLPRPSAYQS